MKKLLSILILILLVACQSNDTQSDLEESNKSEKESQLEVDKNLLNVEVTLPPSMFEGDDIDEVIANAKEKGVKEVTQNDDGSLTYKMSKATHREVLDSVKDEINVALDEMETSEDYPSIKEVSANNSFTEFTVEVEKEAYENSLDGFALFGLGIYGGYYQIFNGVDPDDYKVTIYTIDQETQEDIGTLIIPDDLEDLESETGDEE
ncbi:hypothetical protein [Ornithinibacillus halophilus]|uniref:Antigen I/II N-terminal domain-containing protein n=1 Tax=Ornithinibacillus halophilus TaxID=930117 RepID=A0A1M5FV94_9BACI|nr:hypothetical protein [Ornithinibacillus halophilus]SHF95359.1 hypothetical protein SAMN05216225_101042 [Ornithinibacillus halophilus]